MKFDIDRYYLVRQSEIDKIDALIGALNLAVGEILQWRPVMENPESYSPAQNDYDNQIAKIIYLHDPIDF